MLSKQIQILLLSLLATACSSKLDRDSYVRWVNDTENKLHVRKTTSEFVYDLQYQPADYVLLQRGVAVDSSYQQRKRQVDSTQYFTLKIGLAGSGNDFINDGTSSMSEKQEKLYYFSYQFQDDIHLDDNGQLLPCVLYHFERSVDLKPERTFVLGFENPHPEGKTCTLVITSYRLGGTPVRIEVSKENIPTLKI